MSFLFCSKAREILVLAYYLVLSNILNFYFIAKRFLKNPIITFSFIFSFSKTKCAALVGIENHEKFACRCLLARKRAFTISENTALIIAHPHRVQAAMK